eukprot:2002178-Pyramimonas_sp.AAC.1
MPVAQGAGADATWPSHRGRPPVVWAQQLTARPARSSKSVSGRNKICAMHPLRAVTPVTGQAELTDGASRIPLYFNAVR